MAQGNTNISTYDRVTIGGRNVLNQVSKDAAAKALDNTPGSFINILANSLSLKNIPAGKNVAFRS